MKDKIKKFKAESEKLGMPEASIFLLRKFQAHVDDINSLLARSIQHMCMACACVDTVGGAGNADLTQTFTYSINAQGIATLGVGGGFFDNLPNGGFTGIYPMSAGPAIMTMEFNSLCPGGDDVTKAIIDGTI